MIAVMVYVSLIVSAVGVPLIAHVLLLMDSPAGRGGETLQVAPETSYWAGGPPWVPGSRPAKPASP